MEDMNYGIVCLSNGGYAVKHEIAEEEEKLMKEQTYLFVFEDDTTYEMSCGISLKDAVYEMSKYTGNNSELFRKSLFSGEIGENDVNDIINLFNHWCYYSCIKSVYVVKEKLFPVKEEECLHYE